MTILRALYRGAAATTSRQSHGFPQHVRIFLRHASHKHSEARPSLEKFTKKRVLMKRPVNPAPPAFQLPSTPVTSAGASEVDSQAKLTEDQTIDENFDITKERPKIGPGAYWRELRRRIAPTMLYGAPNHAWFYIGAWSVGAACGGAAFYTYTTMYLNPPEGVSDFVAPSFGAFCVAIVLVGTYFTMNCRKVVKKIRVLPLSELSKVSPDLLVSRLAPNQLPLEIVVRRMIPFLPPYSVYALTSQVTLSQGLGRPAINEMSLDMQERILRAHLTEKWNRENENFLMKFFRLLTSPFNGAWEGISMALTKDGLADVSISNLDGTPKFGKYKLDITGGVALNDGRALDMLVTVAEPESKKKLRLYRDAKL